MNIVMVGHKYVPSREGGVEIVVENLATHMAADGHNVILFNRKRKEYPVISEYKGCRVQNIFTINKRSFDAIIYAYFATRKVKKMCKKGELDVVHFHAEGPCYFLNKLPKKGKRNFKLVVTIHGLDWKRGKWGGLASRILKKGEERAVKCADEIIVLSKSNQEYFKKTYGIETTLIPNGVDLPELKPADMIKQMWGLDKDNYLLFLARLVPEKGLHYLLDAWKKVCDETKTEKKLVIAGGSSHDIGYYEDIQSKVHDCPNTIMTGFVQGQVWEELYSNAYLYVLPSDIEGMPMSLLEAMAYGNICLVSDIPENTEVIRETDMTFMKGNVDELAEKIKYALTVDMRANRRQYQYKTWNDVKNDTIAVYKR